MRTCTFDTKHIINYGNHAVVDGIGLINLISCGVINPTDLLFNAVSGKASAVRDVMSASKHLRLRGYITLDNQGEISAINFDELFWHGQVLPSKNDMLRFMSVIKRPDELEVTARTLRAWWD